MKCETSKGNGIISTRKLLWKWNRLCGRMEKIRHCYHKKAKPTLTIWNRGGDGVISNNLTNKKKICETTIKKIENKNKVKKKIRNSTKTDKLTPANNRHWWKKRNLNKWEKIICINCKQCSTMHFKWMIYIRIFLVIHTIFNPLSAIQSITLNS